MICNTCENEVQNIKIKEKKIIDEYNILVNHLNFIFTNLNNIYPSKSIGMERTEWDFEISSKVSQKIQSMGFKENIIQMLNSIRKRIAFHFINGKKKDILRYFKDLYKNTLGGNSKTNFRRIRFAGIAYGFEFNTWSSCNSTRWW
jgi:hypothetical protein